MYIKQMESITCVGIYRYNKLRQTVCTRSCKVCATVSSGHWHVGTSVMEAMGSQKDMCEFGGLDWICDECCTTLVYPKPGRSRNKYHKCRKEVLEYCNFSRKVPVH